MKVRGMGVKLAFCEHCMEWHWEEPPQNPNKSARKMFFFHGNFYMGIFTWLFSKTNTALHGNVLPSVMV